MAGIKGQPAPKPSDLSPSVPETDFGALDSLQGDFSNLDAIDASSLNLSDSGTSGGISTDPSQSGESVPMQVLDAAGRVLDYPGGFVRAAGAAAAGAISGNPNVVTKEDLKSAAVGKGPSSSEYLRRLGVSEGGSVELPVLGKVTLRGVEGLALDVMSDPLTLIAKTMKSAPYIAKLLESPGRASDALGEAVYKSAIRAKSPGNAESAKQVGKILVDQGAPVGGPEVIAQRVDEATQTMSGIRQGLFDRFAEVKGKIAASGDTFKKSQGVIENLKKNPNLRELGESLEMEINKYQAEGWVPIETASLWVTQLHDELPKSVLKGSKTNNVRKMFKAALMDDLQTAIVKQANEAEAGLGSAILEVNQKWGALLDVAPDLAKESTGTLGKQIDAAVLAAGGVKPYIVKKSFDIATGPYARTVVGKALMKAGQGDVVNRLSRQVVKDITGNEPE